MIENALNQTIERSTGQLREVFDEPVQNQTALNELFVAFRHFSTKKDESLNNLRQISRALQYVSLEHTVNLVHLAETIRLACVSYLRRRFVVECRFRFRVKILLVCRWPLTMGVLCLLLVFCIVLLFGVARHSRYALIMWVWLIGRMTYAHVTCWAIYKFLSDDTCFIFDFQQVFCRRIVRSNHIVAIVIHISLDICGKYLLRVSAFVVLSQVRKNNDNDW